MHLVDLDCLDWRHADELSALVRRSIKEQWSINETKIRSMLGRWVSETEPSIVFDWENNVIGLCRADDPQATIIVRFVN